MKILVTGGNGFLGQKLVKKLISAKHKVTVLDRVDSKIKGVETLKLDITNKRSLKPLKNKGFNIVYHLAAILDETSPILWDVNVNGTKNLLETFKDESLERFIMLNPIGLLGEVFEPAREDFPYAPSTPYEKSKVEAERTIMDYRLKHQIPYTIIRASPIIGPNQFWKQIFKAAKDNYPMIGKGKNKFHLIYIDDAVDALVQALTPKARNQIYNIAAPNVLTYRELYKTICKELKVPFPQKTIPVIAAKALALAHETKSKIQKTRPNVTMIRASIDRLVRNRWVDISKAQKELGFKPKYTMEKAIQKTLKELKYIK